MSPTSAEAATFLLPEHIVYNATVNSVDWAHASVHSSNHYSDRSNHPSPVTVTLANGTTLTADYVICTFSLGVLQNDEVEWVPRLPGEYLGQPSHLSLSAQGSDN